MSEFDPTGLEEELTSAFDGLEEELKDLDAWFNSEEAQAAFRELEAELSRIDIGGAENGRQ